MAALRLFLALLTATAFVWLVSTEDQRHRYLVWLGLAEPAVEADPSPPPSPLDFAVGFPTPRRTGSGPLDGNGLEFSPNAHSGVGSPCVSVGAAHPTHASRKEIYQWVGEDGRTHFSDKPPDTEPAKVVGQTADGGVGMFSADYRYLGKGPSPEFRLALQRNIGGVFRIFESELRFEEAAPVHVNVTIIDGKERFIRFRNENTSGLVTTTSGYYSFSNNEAVVRWVNHARTLAVARHEISHLALGNWVGTTPLWLNEGMAELMERLEFQQSFARAEAPTEKIAHLRGLHHSERLPNFRWFLQSNRKDWNNIGDDIAYPYAWSIVQFLIQNSQRRRLVSDYLNSLADHRCQKFDHTEFFETHYRGGLDALENDWRRWLLQATPVALQL